MGDEQIQKGLSTLIQGNGNGRPPTDTPSRRPLSSPDRTGSWSAKRQRSPSPSTGRSRKLLRIEVNGVEIELPETMRTTMVEELVRLRKLEGSVGRAILEESASSSTMQALDSAAASSAGGGKTSKAEAAEPPAVEGVTTRSRAKLEEEPSAKRKPAKPAVGASTGKEGGRSTTTKPSKSAGGASSTSKTSSAKKTRKKPSRSRTEEKEIPYPACSVLRGFDCLQENEELDRMIRGRAMKNLVSCAFLYTAIGDRRK